MCKTLIQVGAILLFLGPSAPGARAEEKPGPNRRAAEAAKWLEATGDRFSLTLSGCADTLVFTTDKAAVAAGPKGTVFLLTADEAASVVRALVDCGMWGRSDTLPLGPVPPGRYLTVGPADTQRGAPWWWHLGDCTDDVSTMVIVRHLLTTLPGERERAVRHWLSEGREGEKK